MLDTHMTLYFHKQEDNFITLHKLVIEIHYNKGGFFDIYLM